MLPTKILLSVALLARSVLADGAAIVSALQTITADTIQLNETVSSWNGGLLGTLPIIVQSTALLEAINNGTKVAEASANLTLLEAFAVAEATLTLAADVNQTLATIEAARPKFDDLLLGPVILLNLELEKSATDKFGAAVSEKVPSDLQSTAAGLVAEIDAGFDVAIAAYEHGI